MVLLRLTSQSAHHSQHCDEAAAVSDEDVLPDQILIVTVVPHNLLSDEGLIFFYGAEVVTAPQYQRLTDTPFQMSVGTFNRAIFVALTGIIVYALHSVVLTESSITLSQLAASIFALLFPCCPQAVRFMFYRHSAQLSEGFLQTFSQSREAHHPAQPASSSSGSIPDGSDTTYAPTTYRRW